MTAATPPPEWELRRIEAAAELLAEPACPHSSKCRWHVLTYMPGSDHLPRCVETIHAEGCPLFEA